MNVLIPLWFGFWRRFYGAEKPWFPSQLNRISYGVALGASTFFLFPMNNWWALAYAPILVIAYWVGMSFVKYAKYWNMKTVQDWLMMAWNGFMLMAPVGIVLCWHSWHAALLGLAGIIALPVGYWLGWKMKPLGKYLSGGTEWGEFLSNVIIGASAVLISTTN